MQLLSIIDELLEVLNKEAPHMGKKMFVGLDGYVDRIQKVVKSQTTFENNYFSTMPELAERIGRAAGKSAQLELVNQVVKAGGNAPIMAHALGMLDIHNHCLGNFGAESIHPVFKTMSANCKLLSLGNPAETNALEFEDGKLILSELSAFSMLDWEDIQQKYAIGHITGLLEQCHMIALVDWCNLPFATNIWHGILSDVLPKLNKTVERHYFFDLADPSKKSVPDIIKVLDVIRAYGNYGTVTLGLNENEAFCLAQALFTYEEKPFPMNTNLEEICQYIFNKVQISLLLVHPLDRSVIVTREGVRSITGRLVKKPRISTGGGDNLNAGFCFARMAGCNIEASVVLGMATSGAYVQDGYSPDLLRLQRYLKSWKAELEK